MRIVYKEGSRRSMSETAYEVRQAVAAAIALVEGKRGFRTHSETWWDCELVITIGHNIYTTNIHLQPSAKEEKARRNGNYHNGYAWFNDGAFWANFSRQKVEII